MPISGTVTEHASPEYSQYRVDILPKIGERECGSGLADVM
jgi:hypothetical protein